MRWCFTQRCCILCTELWSPDDAPRSLPCLGRAPTPNALQLLMLHVLLRRLKVATENHSHRVGLRKRPPSTTGWIYWVRHPRHQGTWRTHRHWTLRPVRPIGGLAWASKRHGMGAQDRRGKIHNEFSRPERVKAPATIELRSGPFTPTCSYGLLCFRSKWRLPEDDPPHDFTWDYIF